MWKKSRQVAAFTLLECLIALLVLSGGVLLFEGLTKLVTQEIHYQATNPEKDWLLFSQQLRRELEATSWVKIENNKLYVDKAGQVLAFGKSKADDFRKTNGKGQGYQPMLYGLKSATVSNEKQQIRIDFVFENGLERTFLYAFPEKS